MVGIADPSNGINVLREGEVAFLNQAFGRSGSANEGHPTYLPSPDGSSWAFFLARFYNLKEKGVLIDRSWGHDPQALFVMLAAGKERTAEVILEYLDAAAVYGIKCIVTLGGFSDPSTCDQIYDLFRLDSALTRDFVDLAAFVADKISGHPALIVLELLNEPDFMTAILGDKNKNVPGYWLPKFGPAIRGELKDANGKPIPPDPFAMVNAFSIWNDGLISMVKNKQTRPGTPIGMGTAIDSNIWSDGQGNPRMDWLSEKANPTIIPKLTAGNAVITAHFYLNENNDVHRAVLKGEKVPALVAAARKVGKTLIIGETGDLWNGGTYDPWIAAMFNAYPVEHCFMVRWWDPKVFSYPYPIPKRVPYDSTPEPPVEDPIDPPAEEPDQPTDPVPDKPQEEDPPTSSDPGQDTEDPAEEPGEPNEDEPPADDPVEDPPESEDPPIVVPDEPSVPQTGRGFVLFRIFEVLLGILKKFKRGGKR